ncbi:MAG: RluA family pseudouridine synthase [Treponema sp.]|jgi:23S rRNA pseudouridine955/2504/2580 synthase|nr:RluA family pseudouridine synthase [Treponema sp.]
MMFSVAMTAASDDNNRRLDRILRKALGKMALSEIYLLLRKGLVLVDGKRGAPSDRIKAGSVITIPQEAVLYRPEPSKPASSSKAVLLAPYILWEGSGLLIVNKPAGLGVHGPASLETMVLDYFAEKIPFSLSFKPGPLHRLDKPTSGIIVFSASLEGARYFSALLQDRRIKKQYLALTDGTITAPAAWTDFLRRDKNNAKTFVSDQTAGGAQAAETLITPLGTADSYSLVKVEIHTGRTHQIRSQAAFHGHPLAGDKKYGGSFQPKGFLLHAYTLEFPENPMPSILRAPLPNRFREKILTLFGKNLLDTVTGS